MGRKSSGKTHARESTTQGPPPDEPRSSKPLILAGVVVLAAVVGGFAFINRSDKPAPEDRATLDQAPAAAGEPRWAKMGPHTQANFPPLPTQPYAPPRPNDVVRAAYIFAAEHPEILSYVPCFCGCERGGHRGNEDCFVAERGTNGDVTAWEPHGLECTVCIDVATEARQMFTSGASVRDIRAAIEKKWAGFNGGHTPTPHPPAKAGG